MQRQTQTKQQIKIALTNLLKSQSFEELTVSKISQEAGINRGTFYLHYVDKYDLLTSLKQETLDFMHETLRNVNSDSLHLITQALAYLQEDIDFIQVISNTTYVQFSQSLKAFISQILIKNPDFKKQLAIYYQLPEIFAQEVYLASIEAIINTWIQSGAKESPEKIAHYLVNISIANNI